MGLLFTKTLIVCGSCLLIVGAVVGAVRASGDSTAQWVVYDVQQGEAPFELHQTWAGSPRSQPLDVTLDAANGTGLAAAAFGNDDSVLVVQATNADGGLGIFRANLDSDTLYPLTTAFERAFEPAIAPDGNWIVFTVETDRMHLWLMAADGSNPRQLTHTGDRNWQAGWFPDSQHIAFARLDAGTLNLYQLDVASGDMQPLTDNGIMEGTPAISPDGQQIAFVAANGRSYHLTTMALDGRLRRTLTSGTRIDSHPVFSSDGRWIYFASFDGNLRQIFRIHIDGTHLERVSNTTGNTARPTLSPVIDRYMQAWWPLLLGMLLLAGGGGLAARRSRQGLAA